MQRPFFHFFHIQNIPRFKYQAQPHPTPWEHLLYITWVRWWSLDMLNMDMLEQLHKQADGIIKHIQMSKFIKYNKS